MFSKNFFANKSSHPGDSLVKGSQKGNTVTCPRHGARFDAKTGQAVKDAKISFVKMKVRGEESYTVEVDGTDILVLISRGKLAYACTNIAQHQLHLTAFGSETRRSFARKGDLLQYRKTYIKSGFQK